MLSASTKKLLSRLPIGRSPLRKIILHSSKLFSTSSKSYKTPTTRKTSGSNPALTFPCLDKLERKMSSYLRVTLNRPQHHWNRDQNQVTGM